MRTINCPVRIDKYPYMTRDLATVKKKKKKYSDEKNVYNNSPIDAF